MICRIKNRFAALLILGIIAASCASTGPKVTSQEIKQKKDEFNLQFFQATRDWLPRVYRVGYQLVKEPVPGHGKEKPEYNFTGVGVDELKDYGRKAFGIDEKVNGVLVLGVYPGSMADGLDIQPGDVITRMGSKKIKSLGSYFKAVRDAKGDKIQAEIWRRNDGILKRELPVEKVYYNAQFFLSPTPQFDANALFSKIEVGIGALRYSRNDDELAVIMGHELAHVTLRHSAKKLGAGVGMGLAYGAVAGVIDVFTVPGLGQAIVMPMASASQAALSRRYEREADYFGLQHAFHSGFDVANGSKVFARLGTDAPGFQVLAYTFASHPNTPERVLRLEKSIEELTTNFPNKSAAVRHEDWEIIIPMEAGESLETAVKKLAEERQLQTALKAAQPATAQAVEQKNIQPPQNVFSDFDFTAEKSRPMK